MKRAVWLLLGLSGCRACSSPPAPPVAVVDAAIPVDAAAPVEAAAPPTEGTISKILFSLHGRLAFLFEDAEVPTAFRVIDIRTGRQRFYAGVPPKGSMLGFDNRCDVSARGYTPNVDIQYAETDSTENFFVRHLGREDVREDFDTGLPAPAPPPPYDAGMDSKVDFVDLATGLLVTSRMDEGDAPQRQKRCLFDLHAPPGPGLCAVYQPPDMFDHSLASDDGKIFAWNSVVFRESTKARNDDDYARDSSNDECFLLIANLSVGKVFKSKSPCALTGERPLRFEGDTLITDNSYIYRCAAVVTRQYDVKTGRLIKETKGPPTPDDIDAKLAAAIAKKTAPSEGMSYLNKQVHWPPTYGLDALVSWSEGTSVLARKGSDLLLCQKRGGTCGAPLMAIDEGVVAGGDTEGKIFGVVSKGHFVAIDALTGAKKIDVPLND